MRVSFLVYGVLYVAIEIVGNQLEKVGWPQITPLDVAEALTDAFLAIVVCIALVVAVDLAPIVLRDVEDLSFADFDLVLADKLADAYDAADVATALARLLGSTPAALAAHDLDDQAAELAR